MKIISLRLMSAHGARGNGLFREKGFTLFEVLIALAVLSIAFVSIFQLFSADLRAVNASDDYSIAVMKAEAKMREVLDSDSLTEEAWSETSADGYRTDVSVAIAEKARTETLPVELLEVTLKMTWAKFLQERSVTLKTMKVVRKKV